MSSLKLTLAILSLILLPAPLGAAEAGTQPPRQVGYDRPAKNPHQSRSAIAAQHGIVATSQPLAAQAGLEVLKQGGNAADAAIATNAMLGLVEPMSCGIGGDMFVIYWDAKTQKLYGLNASGRSPYDAHARSLCQQGSQADPRRRAALLDGARLRGRLGRSAHALRHSGRSPIFSRRPSTTPRAVFRSARSSPAVGPVPSESLRSLARLGQDVSARRPRAEGRRNLPQSRTWPPATARSPTADATLFIDGDIARQIVAFSQANGGLFFSGRLRRSHHRIGSTRSRPTIAATTCGNCPPTARESRRSRFSICSRTTTCAAWARQPGPDCTCSSKPRSWPTPIGRNSMPTPISTACRV